MIPRLFCFPLIHIAQLNIIFIPKFISVFGMVVFQEVSLTTYCIHFSTPHISAAGLAHHSQAFDIFYDSTCNLWLSLYLKKKAIPLSRSGGL
jgi:hypothetical protein